MLMYILLGYFISNLITFIVAIISKENEEMIISVSFGFLWFLILPLRFSKIINKWNSFSNQAKRLEKATKKILKKKNINDKNWEKFYNKQSKKSGESWDIFKKTKTNKQLEEKGYYKWKEKYLEKKYQKEYDFYKN